MEPVYTDELEGSLDLFERGNILKSVPSNAWEVIYDTIHEIVQDVVDQHSNMLPGDPSVVASHAAVYVLTGFEKHFKDAMDSAMAFAAKPPKEFLEFMYQVRDRLDVLKQQGES